MHRVLEPPSREVFLWRIERLLTRYLSDQGSARYFLAPSAVDETGYRRAGGWYWLVAYSPMANVVSWVSADWFVYGDSATGFVASPDELRLLPGAPEILWPDDDEAPPG